MIGNADEKPKEEEPDAVKIGLRIQQARNERGMTQEHLASLESRNTNYIGNLENERSCPHVKLLILLAKALDVNVDSLLRDDPDFNPTYQPRDGKTFKRDDPGDPDNVSCYDRLTHRGSE